MGQVMELRSKADLAAGETGDDEPEAILEDWAPGKELVTVEGCRVLLDALELLDEQLLDELRRSGCSDRAVFQQIIWCEDLQHTIEVAERIEVAVGSEPEPGGRLTLAGACCRPAGRASRSEAA